MPRFAYVSSRFVPHDQAVVHIEDRGYQFGDGVYEVIPLLDGAPIDCRAHLDRLAFSLNEISIDWPMPRAVLIQKAQELMRRNRLTTGLLYLQVTRGVAPRNHAFPNPSVRSVLVMTSQAGGLNRSPHPTTGVDIITQPDQRWARPDIKSLNLLPNCMAKTKAVEAGAVEAWLLDKDNFVREGASSSAWIVSDSGKLVTYPTNGLILAGITRGTLADIAKSIGLPLDIRPFSLDEALNAKEVFITGASLLVKPVRAIDGHVIQDGKPGPVSAKLQQAYLEHADRKWA